GLVSRDRGGVTAVCQGWIVPASVSVCPADCFQSIEALAWVAAASSAKPHRGSTARAGKAAPAAPNPLTKLRRLVGARPLSEVPPVAMFVLPTMGSHSQHAARDVVALASQLTDSEAGATCAIGNVGFPAHLCGPVHA